MREIKFRGKCMFSNEWVYGDLIHKRHDRNALMIQDEKGLGSDVVPESVGQFTGLRDKNNKEIYEGDIVLSKLKRARKYDEILQICFDDSEYCGKDKHGSSTSLSLLEDYHTVEVIGNIHDNPELLEF